jgi:hypothetical protein
MTSAPQSERRRRQDDAHMACRWNAADQARGRIKLDVFRRGTTVADMLREMLEPAFPADGSAS